MSIDPSAYIASTARVHTESMVGPGVHVGEYSVIESDVIIGANCRLDPYVYVKRWTTLGESNELSAGVALGTDPLDKAFTGERSYLKIGSRNKIREYFTISRGTRPESETRIGDNNFIMTSGHIAHDCEIGNDTVIASCALIAGHVEIQDRAFISGGVVVHQYSRIGALVMVGGNSRVNQDLPPYFLYSGFNAAPVGLNLVGLRRAGFNAEEVRSLKSAYRTLFRSGLKLADALSQMETGSSPLVQSLVEFVRRSKRGIARPAADSSEKI